MASSKWKFLWLAAVVLTFSPLAKAQHDNSEARPPLTKADLEIVKRAREILNSPAKWNRADTRVCPADEKTFSLYCALEKATDEVTGKFEHRGAAMQQARFVIDEIVPNADYGHRLMGYNNDPTTTFADIQTVFNLLEQIIAQRLREQAKPPQARVSVSKPDIQVVEHARQILDSPAKWNRADTQDCPADAKTFSLFCALQMADVQVNGQFNNSGAAIVEARHVIDETAPNHKNYKARLTDFNNDPTISFPDIQKLLQLVEERLTKRLAEQARR